MSITIKDVAELAEVSVSTVSRVINKSKPVSNEVKQRVIKAIKDLNYQPNEIARSLVTKKSNLIGLIVTDIRISYISEMVRGIEEIGKLYGYDILLSSSYGDVDTELHFIDVLKNKQAEAIVIITEEKHEEVIKALNDINKPYSYLNRFTVDERNSFVQSNHKRASYDLGKLILKKGHRNVMFVCNSLDEDTAEFLKFKGFKKAFQEQDLKLFKYKTKEQDLSKIYSQGEKIFSLAKSEDISCIYCCRDEVAIEFMNYCYDNGIKVPGDISVCGYGGIPIARKIRPKLTTIIEPYYDIGAVSVNKLIRTIEKNELESKIRKKMMDSGEGIDEKKISEIVEKQIEETKKVSLYYKIIEGSSVKDLSQNK